MSAYQVVIRSRVVFESIRPDTGISTDRLASLDGLRIARKLAEYLAPELTELGISGGEVRLEWDRARKKLMTLATFLTPDKLAKSQQKLLIAEVRGQYSDGFAENGIPVNRSRVRGCLWLAKDGKLTLQQVPSSKRLASPNPLLQAARLSNLDGVERLIAKGIKVNASGAHGITPLVHAIHNRHEAIIKALVAAGAHVDRCTATGTAPLQHACMSGASVKIHRLLLKAGAAINATDQTGLTALHYAANRGLLAVTRLLIEHGANVNAQDERGSTPLMFADPDHIDVIKCLLLNGARTDLRNDRGHTAAKDALAEADSFTRMGSDYSQLAKSQLRKAEVITQWRVRPKMR